MNDESNNESWLSSAPTWLHLLVAVLGLAGGMVLFLTQVERRFTIIEERQAQTRDALRLSNESSEVFRREAMSKLDSVAAQMTFLTLEFAKHQARYETQRSTNTEPPPRYRAQP